MAALAAALTTANWRKLRLTLVSAENLEDVRLLGKLKVYAEVSFDERPDTVHTTLPDRERETNPRWNSYVDYLINESALQRQSQLTIVVELKCERSLGEDRYVGRVRIGLRQLFDAGKSSEDVVSYPVEDCPRGRLHVKYSFGEPGDYDPSDYRSQTQTDPHESEAEAARRRLEIAEGAHKVTQVLLEVVMLLRG